MTNLSIAFAGSTQYAHNILTCLIQNNFTIPYVLTPRPKLVGRNQILTFNPVEKLCQKENLTFFSLDQKIGEYKNHILQMPKVDFLLVTDFGYFIPNWLLNLPRFSTLNIHPSLLPKWRGSSPGQFALLFGQKKSAITLMKINKKMDQGDLIAQLNFNISPSWTQNNYYQFAFNLITNNIVNLLHNYQNLNLKTIKQPPSSPTPLARMLKKTDSFIDFNILKPLIQNKNHEIKKTFFPQFSNKIIKLYQNQIIKEPLLMFLIQQAKKEIHHSIIYQAHKAFYNWPGIWTIISTQKGKKIMKIIDLQIDNDKLVILKVKIQGGNIANFNEIKNQIIF